VRARVIHVIVVIVVIQTPQFFIHVLLYDSARLRPTGPWTEGVLCETFEQGESLSVAIRRGGEHNQTCCGLVGRCALQADSIKTRVEGANGFSA
jgi:hypothetical protein